MSSICLQLLKHSDPPCLQRISQNEEQAKSRVSLPVFASTKMAWLVIRIFIVYSLVYRSDLQYIKYTIMLCPIYTYSRERERLYSSCWFRYCMYSIYILNIGSIHHRIKTDDKHSCPIVYLQCHTYRILTTFPKQTNQWPPQDLQSSTISRIFRCGSMLTTSVAARGIDQFWVKWSDNETLVA